MPVISGTLLRTCVFAVVFVSTLTAQDVWIKRDLPVYGAVEHVVVTPDGDFFAQIAFVGMFKSSDQGISWTKISFPVNLLNDFISDDGGVLYIFDATGPGNLYRSTDKGDNWDKIYPINSGNRLCFDDMYRLYALTDGYGVVWSDDSGKTMVETGLNAGFSRIHITSSNIVFVYHSEKCFRSTDRGESWVNIRSKIPGSELPSPKFAISVLCSDPDGNLYAGIRRGYKDGLPTYFFIRSTDYGESWIDNNIRIATPGILASISAGTIINTSVLNLPLRSTDYGDTWHPYYAGHEAHGFDYDLTFTPDGRAVTGSGGCIYITSKPVGVESVAEVPTSLFLAQSYPNPLSTGQNAYINFSLPTQEYVTLIAYNTAGQEVAQIAQGTYPPGTHTALFAASGLPTGVYVYRLVAGGRMESRLLQVLK